MTGSSVREFRAPGRVNLIGEFTDFNDGFVMPAAIGFAATVRVERRADRILAIHSESFGERREFDLDDANARATGHWSDYVRGVAVMLERAGHRVQGADLHIRSDVPMGAGLSSSAALEVAAALALASVSGGSAERKEIALLCQRAENEFVGMRCGVMDQFVSCFGRAGHALMLDCRSLDYRLLPIPSGVSLVICNTMVRHRHAGGEYNRRRADCEAGARHLGARALRDVDGAGLERIRRELPERVYLRCRHVVAENMRVRSAAEALESGDLDTLGRLMAESHRSLRDDFEVSCGELDLMVELASALPGLRGARMTGGGFGGCTINLVDAERADEFAVTIARRYREETGREPEIYTSGAADGAGEL